MGLVVLSRISVMSSAHWKKVCHNKRRGECGWEQRRRIFSRGRVAVFSTAGGICENIQDFWDFSKTQWFLCRCPTWPVKEVIIFIHWLGTTGLHCRQQGRSWNPVLSARRLLDRNGLQTPFWPGLLHILITLWPILLQSNSRGAGEQHQRSFSLPVAAKRKNSLVDLMRFLTPFTKHLTHILKSFVAYIFLSVLFTGTRERRECYFLQVLNLRSCQAKGKLLLVSFEHSLPRLCVGKKAAFCILGTFSGFLSLSWFCTSCLCDFVPGVRLSFLKRREGGASLRWLLFHIS